MSMKNPLTLAGIESATLQFVAQHLNHCATAVPTKVMRHLKDTGIERVDLTQTGYECADWTYLAHDMEEWWALVNRRMYLQVT